VSVGPKSGLPVDTRPHAAKAIAGDNATFHAVRN